MKKMTLTLKADVYYKLETIADNMKKPLSEVILTAIDEELTESESCYIVGSMLKNPETFDITDIEPEMEEEFFYINHT